VADTVPDCHLINTDDATFLPSGSVHFSSSGYGVLAYRTAQSILANDVPLAGNEEDMGTLSIDLRNRGANHTLGVAVYTAAATIQFAAFIGGVEVAVTGYARKSMTNNTTTWSAAAARLKTNAVEIEWDIADGAAWGLVDEIRGYNGSSGEEMFRHSLAAPQQIDEDDALYIAVGALDITAAAGAMTDVYVHKFLDLAFGGVAYPAEASTQFAYFNGNPAAAGAEVTGTGYVRDTNTSNSTTWVTASGGQVVSGIDFGLGTAGSNWTAANYFALFNAAGTGLMLSAALSPARSVLTGETETIQAGRIRVQLL
ncbi:MAG TPA: hypothetical protein VGB05_06965, partial [Pyrinomonadaceae bacterium]